MCDSRHRCPPRKFAAASASAWRAVKSRERRGRRSIDGEHRRRAVRHWRHSRRRRNAARCRHRCVRCNGGSLSASGSRRLMSRRRPKLLLRLLRARRRPQTGVGSGYSAHRVAATCGGRRSAVLRESRRRCRASGRSVGWTSCARILTASERFLASFARRFAHVVGSARLCATAGATVGCTAVAVFAPTAADLCVVDAAVGGGAAIDGGGCAFRSVVAASPVRTLPFI